MFFNPICCLSSSSSLCYSEVLSFNYGRLQRWPRTQESGALPPLRNSLKTKHKSVSPSLIIKKKIMFLNKRNNVLSTTVVFWHSESVQCTWEVGDLHKPCSPKTGLQTFLPKISPTCNDWWLIQNKSIHLWSHESKLHVRHSGHTKIPTPS